jgi:NADPH-dependent ferric siderophore reductase
MSQSALSPVQADAVDPRLPRRVRHEPKRRRLDVVSVEPLTPNMVRVTLSGNELPGFTSLGFDDHIKLFFPDVEPTEVDSNGAPKPVSRDYTPRRYDAAANILEIDFALHDAGPATAWARQAKSGDVLHIGGPRGSLVIPTGYDWHLLVGDDTALPAIGRRLAELPAGATAVVIAEVDGEDDKMAFDSAADVSVTWAYRRGAEAGSTDLLARTLRGLRLPAGGYYAWVACESLTAKALRAQLIAENGANPKWMRAAGYWRRGAAAVHDTFND